MTDCKLIIENRFQHALITENWKNIYTTDSSNEYNLKKSLHQCF